MNHKQAVEFMKWCNKYPWITDYTQKIDLDMDAKVCQTNPRTWTYMFRSKEARDKFRGIVAEAN